MATKAVAEAEARLAELETYRANLVASIDEAEADRKPHEAKLAAIRRRRAKRKIVAYTANAYQLTTAAALVVSGWDSTHGLAGKKPREILEAIAGGGVSLTVGSGGVTYKARGLSQRVRTPNAEAIKAFNRADRAYNRAVAAQSRASQARNAAMKAVYETGEKIAFEALVADVAEEVTAKVRLAAHPEAADARFKLNQLTDGQFGGLADAKAHLAWVKAKNPDKGVCPCRGCQKERQDAIRRRDLVARLAELPKRRATCPSHGKRLMASERVRDYFDNKWTDNLPIAWCPIGPHRLIDTPTMEAEAAKAAAVEARKKAHAPKREWTCPNPECGDVNAFEPTKQGYVECGSCHVEFDTDVVKTRKAA